MSHKQERRQFWRSHYEHCQHLGMTLKGYAEQEGLRLSVFYSWSKRFKQEATVDPRFSRVQLASPLPAEYRLRFPSGVVLEFTGEVDEAQLNRLIKTLA